MPSQISVEVSPAQNGHRARLLRWFDRNARDLPWRRTADPYAVWVSEIMLQQTQVTTVVPYHEAGPWPPSPPWPTSPWADQERSLKLWRGPGLLLPCPEPSRSGAEDCGGARGSYSGHSRRSSQPSRRGPLHRPAPSSPSPFTRPLPSSTETSSASSAGSSPSASTRAARETEDLLWSLSASLVPKGKANPFNQGLMELGAMICTPREPRCLNCPLRACSAGRTGTPRRSPSGGRKRRSPGWRGQPPVTAGKAGSSSGRGRPKASWEGSGSFRAGRWTPEGTRRRS